MGTLDDQIGPGFRRSSRQDLVAGLVGVSAIGLAVGLAIQGQPQWWITLLCGAAILALTALFAHWRRTG